MNSFERQRVWSNNFLKKTVEPIILNQGLQSETVFLFLYTIWRGAGFEHSETGEER